MSIRHYLQAKIRGSFLKTHLFFNYFKNICYRKYLYQWIFSI